MRKYRLNNKGLSLVELLIALVIGAILVAGIGSIMIVSSRSFASTSAEAAMQSSAQIVMDHIQDVVVDANQKVYYSYTTNATRPVDESGWTPAVKDAAIPDPESAITFKRLSVYTYNLNQVSSPDAFNQQENKHYDIIWQRDTTNVEKSTIIFEQQNLTYDPTINDIVEVGGSLESEKLADNVVHFACDLSDMETKRIIYVEMDFKKGTKEYHAANNISLRNKVALSTDSISVNRSITMETMDLTAEPGMSLPLAIKSIVTTGNASNSVTYELDGGDGGRTAAGTDLSNPRTLYIDPTERAAVLKLNAVDSAGDKHPFNVYINRVLWTSDISAIYGGSDAQEGIEIVDSPTDDEVDAGTSCPLTVKLNSNPGAPGTDRTRPEVVTAEIKNISPATTADVKLEEAGSLSWILDVPKSVKKDTKIRIRFTAGHSMADGGIAVRTMSYPDGKAAGSEDGVYKEILLTVTEDGVQVSKSPFLRGMKGKVLYADYLEQFFNEAGKSEWEEYKKINQGLIDNHYLVWKKYASRPAVDGSKNRNYSSDSEGWTVLSAATDEKYDDLSGYQSAGWNVIYGGKEGNFDGTEFASLSPDEDSGIVFSILCQYKENNATKWFVTSPAQTIMYGFREQISNGESSTRYEKQFDLGSMYKLDSWDNNQKIRNERLVNPTYFVWQKEPCFDNLSFGGNGGGLSISTYFSETAFSGGESIGSMNNIEETYGGEPYLGGKYVYMARKMPMTNIQNKIDQNFFNNFNSVEKEYFIWPKFTYSNASFDRTSGYLEFKVKQGNIPMKYTNNGKTVNVEGFVPYPEYTTENGFTINAHPEFYGADYDLGSSYKGVGQREISHYKNANYSDKTTSKYVCLMKYVNNVYYLKIKGLAEYKYDPSQERWVYIADDKVTPNLISTINGSSTKDVYLPGVGDDEFFTGFKSIADQDESEKNFASNMLIYYTYGEMSQYEEGKYKILYYRKDGKYWVDIYTLGDNDIYKSYSYNEKTKVWDLEGDIFSYNINYKYWNENYRFYLPVYEDKEWFDYKNYNDTKYRYASKIAIYRYRNNKWTKYNNPQDNNTPVIYYNCQIDSSGNKVVYVAFVHTDEVYALYRYDYTNSKWTWVSHD